MYRKLGIGIREIKILLEEGDDRLLDQISSEKEQEIRKLTVQWEELKKYIQTKEIESVCSVIDYETIGEKLKDMFPGFYGTISCIIFFRICRFQWKQRSRKKHMIVLWIF